MVDTDMVDADMVDEPHAAADASSPAAATALDWDAADATEGPTDANLGADKTGGGASSVDSPPIGLGAILVEEAARAPPPVGSGRQGDADQVPEQRLVAGTRSASICAPLWKVRSPLLCTAPARWPRVSLLTAGRAAPSARAARRSVGPPTAVSCVNTIRSH